MSVASGERSTTTRRRTSSARAAREATDLRRHVPQVALTWDDEVPGTRWRRLDGTLVFADISGFTALTEKLSAKGRIGAEEIVETLNRVFGGMIDTAAARGADLLKFGGDALLLLFRGDDHAQRACDAAVEMRIALREAAAVPTSVGRLRLSMSVGIHSGDIYLFLVGEPTRELLILGDAATLTAEAEKSANAGEIVVSEATAKRIGKEAVKLRDDGALLLRRRRPSGPAAGPESVSHIEHGRVVTLFPQALGEYLDPRPPEPEHRIATIGFVRFSGTDALLDGPGPDAVADAVHETVRLMEECLALEGVTMLATDIDSDGGKFFLASGVPQASEDDEGRMLRALRRFVDAGPPLDVQAGINRGHVFAAEVGASERAAYSSMGDTTNTAARIMAKAPAGSIYAHPAVLEQSRTMFVTTPAGPFPMKGKALPLLVYDVGEEAGTREVGEDARLPFRGRDAELQTVQQVLDAAMAGRGGVVSVVGPTGIGKSRLVHEASDAVPDLRAFVLRAEPYGQTSSYRVLRDPLRRVLDIERGSSEHMGRQLLHTMTTQAPELAPMAPLIADLVSATVPATPETEAIDPQFRPDVAADVLVSLLATLRPGPLLIVADGAQWIDQASSRLLERVAWATDENPWALVVMRRGETEGFLPDKGLRIDLDPLSDDVITRLVIDATEAAPIRPHEIDGVVARAEGNPLFVEEVTRVARAVGSLEVIPESLGAAMSVQIDLLAPNARRILRYASVLGRTFRREVLRETLSDEGLHVDHATFTQLSDFLEADGPQRFRFRNSLLRDAAYEELAFRTRARLHLAAGLATERLSQDLEVDSPTLSMHFSRAGDYDRAWRYGRMAGEMARRAYANAEAAHQYDLALEAARHIDVPRQDLIDGWAVLGNMRQLSGNLDGSVVAFRRAASLAAQDPVQEADLIVVQARVYVRARRSLTSALRATTRAQRILGEASGDSAEKVRVQADCIRALVRLHQNKPREARAIALVAADGAARVGDFETQVQALNAVDEAEHMLGMPVNGVHTREALEVCMAHGLRWRESIARMNLGVMAVLRGHWDEAIEHFERSRQVANEAGYALGAAVTEINLGDVLISRGQVDEAERMLTDAVRVNRASRNDWWAVNGEMQLARVQTARGQFDDALASLATVIEKFDEMGDGDGVLEARLYVADAWNSRGEFAEAMRVVDGAEAALREEGGPLAARMLLQRGRALVGLGRVDEATVVVDAGLVAAREGELLFEEAQLLRLREQLALRRGSQPDAETLRHAADALFMRLGAQS